MSSLMSMVNQFYFGFKIIYDSVTKYIYLDVKHNFSFHKFVRFECPTNFGIIKDVSLAVKVFSKCKS